jgi:hypothetical protein
MTERGSLRASWRVASTRDESAAHRIDAAQWWTPAVDALLDAFAGESVDAVSAAQTLGRQRAAAGVFLDSARRDVLNAASSAGCPPGLTASLLDAVTLGWVDRTLDTYFAEACVDPLTELTSLSYLMTRLAEIYAEADVDGSLPATDYALVVVRAGTHGDPLEVETRMITVQVALRASFPGGETLARIGPRAAVALARRAEPRFGRSLGRLGTELSFARSENRLPGVQSWVDALPPERDEIPRLFRSINSRSEPS